MKAVPKKSLVATIQEKCRVCYTCVRECPAKAIRIAGGQAEVISERCIGCGNCVRVCSQQAKKVLSGIDEVRSLLASDFQVSACIAPSFPAEFIDIDDRHLIGMVRALGFHMVNETAFGADLTAMRYRRLLEIGGRPHIAANCPAVVEYVCRHHPGIIDYLAPIASPMIATARALRQLHGEDLKIVFIGPCIAKKAETDPNRKEREIDGVLTFFELRELMKQDRIDARKIAPSDFDPPHSRMGALFPVSRGMLQAASISDDLIPGNVLAADGRIDFVEALKEFESGDLNVTLLEVLSCNGCIMGPGIRSDLPLFSKRTRVLESVQRRMTNHSAAVWHRAIGRFSDLDLSRGFEADDQRVPFPSDGEIKEILNRIGKFLPNDELNCGACGYDTCREHAVAIHNGSAEIEMCLPYTLEQLKQALEGLAESNAQLEKVQEALVQSEKLASMGQLAAGIAHEINNPLGIVLMYAHLLLDEHRNNIKLRADMEIIAEQTDRCKRIVAGLLDFARQNKVIRQPVNVRDMIKRLINTLHAPDGIRIEVIDDIRNPFFEIDPDQICQVLTNLLLNAFEAMPEGGRVVLTIRDKDPDHVVFSVRDTGIGISPENMGKLFEPFYTTKQIGKGTGLGLAVAYGIVKMHRGDITVASNTDPAAGPVGAVFTVTIPREEQNGLNGATKNTRCG